MQEINTKQQLDEANWVDLGYGKILNLIFLCGFFYIGWKQLNYGDGNCSPSKPSNLIPRWYGMARSSQWARGRWMIDNLRLAVNSPANPRCQCNSFQPLGYSQLHTLAHVATDYEVALYLLIPNGTADNTQNLQWMILQDECFSRSNLEVLGFMFNIV